MGRDMMRLRRGILLNTPHEEQESGAVASFATDIGKLKECVVEFDPVQDLHGYDSPWPPGGGKNLLELYLARASYKGIDFSLTADGKIHAHGTNSSGATSYSGGNYSTYDGCPWHFPAGTYTISCTVPRSNTDIGTVSFMLRRQSDNERQNYTQLKNGSSTFTIDEPFGAWFWFSVLNGKTVDIDVGLQLEKSSTATSWTPYENICPISGWSEAKVTGTGKNFAILSQQILDNDRTQNGITWKATSKSSFHVSGTATGSSFLTVGYGVTSPYLRFLKAGTYTVSCNFPANCSVYIYGFAIGSGATSMTTLVSGVRANSPRTFTITDDWMINIQALIASGVTIDDEINVQVEPGTTASVYEAYRGVTVTIDLDGTRYGGTLNVTGGKMVVTHASADMGELSYVRTSSADIYVFRNNIGAAPVTDYIQHGLTSIYPFAGTRFISTMPDKSWMIDSSGRFTVRDDSYTDVNAFKTAMTGQTLVYELATPLDVQLTPAQLRAIKGQNNIFADCGDVAVKYWKH